METIQIKDKKFSVSIPQKDIQARVAEIAKSINEDLKGKHPFFLAVLNGAFVFAADLLRGIDMPCEISFVRYSSYSGTSSTGKVNELLGLKESIEGRDVVIVEDIIDSGLTMQNLLKIVGEEKPKSIRIASLLVKRQNLKVNLDIDYCCFDIPNDFIVGYGLDYDGEGRNYPSIYTVTD